jgi:phosphatidylserine/phosphatidylglycerophosphate/cardiolipin synthase-like enzyme
MQTKNTRLFIIFSFVFSIVISGVIPATAAPPPPAQKPSLHPTELVAIGFTPGNADAVVIGVIDDAKKELRMAAYTFTSRSIAAALLRAKRRGVDVAVLMDKPKQSASPFIIPFMNANKIPYRLAGKYGCMHNKFLVVDGLIVQTGSFNYTRAAATANAENVVVLRGTACASIYLKEWNRLWIEAAKPVEVRSRR